jgi:hypothetical protein
MARKSKKNNTSEETSEIKETSKATRTKATATKIKDMTNYLADVKVYELSKPIKRNGTEFNYILAANHKPAHGSQNITMWPSNKEGVPTLTEPLYSLSFDTFEEAFKEIGYKTI